RIVSIGARPLEICSGNQMLDKILVVLDRFDRHENAAEQGSSDQEPNEQVFLLELGRTNGQRHEQAAYQQYGRVCPTENYIEFAARFHEHLAVSESINGIAEKKSAEEQHLGREKYPHAKLGGLALLLNVIELLVNEWAGLQSD